MKLRLLALLVLSAATCVASLEERLAAARKAAPIFERAIADAKEVTLLVIDPHSRYEEKKDTKQISVPGMDGSWTVVKEVTLRNPKALAFLASSLRSGIEKNEGTVAACFLPRHGIRVRIDGREVTMLICFECLQGYAVGYPPCGGFLVSDEPATIWNRVFREAGLEIIK